MKRWLGLVWLVGVVAWFSGGPGRCRAAAVDEAGRLFAMGRPAEAAVMLERLVRTNRSSPDLWFNLGQARAQSGELGRAMAAWRRAARLAPWDGGVRRAMQGTREKLGTRGDSSLGWVVGWLRVEVWALLALLATVVLVGVVAVRGRRPEVGGGIVAVFALVQLGLSLAWGLAIGHRWLSANAVVVQREVSASQAPVPEARSVRPLAEGTEVRVVRRHGEWRELAVDGVRAGWVPMGALVED